MSVSRERELKMTLPGLAAYRLLIEDGSLGPARVEMQENRYFDTLDHTLARSRAILRLRRTSGAGSGRLTFKHGAEREGVPGFFDSFEIEQEVPHELLLAAVARPMLLLEIDSGPGREVVARFGRLELRDIGSLTTERRRLLEAPFPLEIDRVTYPDGEESYELEIETDDPDGARTWLTAELAKRGIEAVPQRRTKLEVLLSRLGVDLGNG